MGMDYAHAVRYLFEKSGMSQAELCRRGGFSRAYAERPYDAGWDWAD